jgi:hypothetical protein
MLGSIESSPRRSQKVYAYEDGTSSDKVSQFDIPDAESGGTEPNREMDLEGITEIDGDGDGKLSKSELLAYVSKHQATKAEKAMLKKMLIGAVLLLVLFSFAISGLTWGVVELSKETKVSADGELLGSSGTGMVKTDSPRTYIVLTDIPKLPPKALDSLHQLSFTTADRAFHKYTVSGFQLTTVADVSVATVYFTATREMEISGDSVIFREFGLGGGITEVNVLIDTQSAGSSLNQRRLQIMPDPVTEQGAHDDFLHRCSVTTGVCYHTWNEIVSLNQPMGSDARRLQVTIEDETAVTYGEIEADWRSISSRGLSGLSAADNFINAALGASNLTISASDTFVLKFIMRERCVNYIELRGECQLHPAPDDSSDNKLEAIGSTRPYEGLTAVDSRWYFNDEIEFSRDKYTLQLKVRYSHDPKAATRKHVILMDRFDASRIVTYDEVTTFEDPFDIFHTFQTPEVYITDYQTPSDLSGEEGEISNVGVEGDAEGLDLRRRLTGVEAKFHSLVRTKITGFPAIHIHDDENFRFIARTQERRRLQSTEDSIAENSDDSMIEDAVEIQPSMTTSGITGLIDLAACADCAAVQNIFNMTGLGSVTKFPVAISSFENNIEAPSEPSALFSGPELLVTAGLIQWPQQSDAVVIFEYQRVEIHHRSELQLFKESHQVDGSTSRRLAAGEVIPFRHPIAERRARRVQELLDVHFDNILDSLASLQAHINTTSDDRMGKARGFEDVYVEEEEDGVMVSRRLRSTLPGNKQFYVKYADHYNGNKGIRKDKNWKREGLKRAFAPDGVLRQQGIDPAARGLARYAYGATVNYAMNLALSAECQGYRNELVRLYDHIEAFTLTTQAQINDKSELVKSSIKDMKDLEESLSKLETIKNFMSPVMPIMGKLPYVGIIVKAFWYVFSNTIEKTVAPANDRLEIVNDKIEQYTIEQKLTKLQEKNDQVAEKILLINEKMSEIGNLLVMVDGMCPNTVGSTTKPICLQMSSKMKIVNDLLDTIIGLAAEFTDFLNLIDLVMNAAFQFMSSALWRAISPILNIISFAFEKIRIVLTMRIEGCIPWLCWSNYYVCTNIGYPCGVRWCGGWCRYPCGANWCSYNACVWVPRATSCKLCISFTIQQIIDGVMSVLAALEAAINAILDGIMKALNITMPSINLPGMPDLGILLKIPQLIARVFVDVFNAIFFRFDLLLKALDVLLVLIPGLPSIPKC